MLQCDWSVVLAQQKGTDSGETKPVPAETGESC